MDERLRSRERAWASGDAGVREGLERQWARATGRRLTLADRARLGLFDVFTTRLREDIVREALGAEAEDFEGGQERWKDPSHWPVELLVNGLRLADVVDQWDYDPQLPAYMVYLPARHLLEEPQLIWPDHEDEDGRTLLLLCECGFSGCGRLVADVHVKAHTVEWTALEHRPQRRRLDLEFVFERGAYERALQDPP